MSGYGRPGKVSRWSSWLEAEMPPQQGWERDGLTGTEDAGVHHEHTHTHARARARTLGGQPRPGQMAQGRQTPRGPAAWCLASGFSVAGNLRGLHSGANVVGETWAGEAHVHGAHPWERRGPRGIPTLGCRRSLLPLTN